MSDDFASLRVLGVRVHDVTMAEAVARIGAWVARRAIAQVVTVNPEFVMRAQLDDAFRVVLNEADLSLADGQGILWAAKRLGHPLRERVTGSDTVPALCALAAERGWRVYFLGAAPGVAAEAARRMQAQHPGLLVVGCHAGSPAVEEEAEIGARIREAQPDLLLVAYGAPAQDLWIARNKERLGVPVCMGIGGTLDFIAGRVPRAPLWMRRHGLEWLFRLYIQPWRWRRMLSLPRYAARVLAASKQNGRR